MHWVGKAGNADQVEKEREYNGMGTWTKRNGNVGKKKKVNKSTKPTNYKTRPNFELTGANQNCGHVSHV